MHPSLRNLTILDAKKAASEDDIKSWKAYVPCSAQNMKKAQERLFTEAVFPHYLSVKCLHKLKVNILKKELQTWSNHSVPEVEKNTSGLWGKEKNMIWSSQSCLMRATEEGSLGIGYLICEEWLHFPQCSLWDIVCLAQTCFFRRIKFTVCWHYLIQHISLYLCPICRMLFISLFYYILVQENESIRQKKLTF